MGLFAKPEMAILLVCRANVCRSPMAEALLRRELALRGLARTIAIDSAGTHAAQRGRPADPRAVQVCARDDINLRKARARQVTEKDFQKFDYILAMDEQNLQSLLEICPAECRPRLSRMGWWNLQGDAGDIADPYYGSMASFEQVLRELRPCIGGFLVKALALDPIE